MHKMDLLYFQFFLVILCAYATVLDSKGVHKHINYYEHLTYDRLDVLGQHNRVKRSLQGRSSGQSHVLLQFQSHGRHFNIRLVPDKTIFHSDLELVNGKGENLDVDTSHIYHGNLYGEKNSVVYGSIVDGIFTGVIVDPEKGSYYVEEAKPFFGDDLHLHIKGGHSVMYHESAVNYPHKYGPQKSCGASDKSTADYMEKIQKSAVIPDKEKAHSRQRRAVSPELNTCLLYIRTDHILWREMKSREKIVGKISEHVKALNEVYKATEFATSSGEKIRNIGFMVKRLMINETANEGDLFYNPNIGVEKFLEYASSENHNDYCLAYVFTQRDFDNGVLGLAWVGSASGTGGICDKYRQYDGKSGKSLNTGIVTFENYGTTVPSRVSHITFTHEVGHNFGSPHDDGIACTPGESPSAVVKSQGNFIMFASATSGQKANNNLFSSCSKANMSKVLESKKDICFVESDRPICGNAIIDEGEECDCGYPEQCEEVGDSGCCYAADEENGCKLKPGAVCSITQGPCCDTEFCTFHDNRKECSTDAECQESQNCSGTGAACPAAQPKENATTACNHGTQVCWGGECSGSICEKYGLKECYCPVEKQGDTSFACHVCCQESEATGTCKSTASIPQFNRTIFLQPGSPCDDFKGYCDMFSRCRKVDADGPLSRLKKAILNPELYRTIKEWIVQYWWAVALMCLALIMLMAGFIKLCSVHTPSNNPRLPKHKQLPGANTLRRRRQAQQQRRNASRSNHEMGRHY